MTNPLSGHTTAKSPATSSGGDGLRDGDVITSPSLTNPFEGLHGNGILRVEDGAYGSSRNAVGAGTPGFITAGSSTGELTVSGGYAVIDGCIYQFANGVGGSHTFTVGTDTNRTGSLPSGLPFSSAKDVWVVVYVCSDNTEKQLKYEMGTPQITSTNTPLLPSTFLDDTGGTSNKQHTVLGIVRYTMAAGQSAVTASLGTPEIHDKRTFLRPTPVYLNHMTMGTAGNTTDTNAIDGNNQKKLSTVFSGVEAGGFDTSPFGAIWQSHNPNGHSVLYYSAQRSISSSPVRNTHRLGPNDVKVYDAGTGNAATATITCTVADIDHIGEGDTIVLVSADSTPKTVTLTMQGSGGSTTSGSTSGTTLTAKTLAGGSYATYTLWATAQAVEIRTAINHHTSFTATNSANVITVTQATLGSAGNTNITITELGATGFTNTNFTGGTLGNLTFTFDQENIFIVTTDAARTINPTGVFPIGHTVEIYHVGGGHTLHFDSGTLNQDVANGEYGKFVSDGSNWHKLTLHAVGS